MTEFVEVQQIVGNRVRDIDGQAVGRIETILAEVAGPRCVIHEFHLGTAALLERIGFSTARLLGFTPSPRLLRVPWKLMDFSDPKHPRVGCSAADLKELQSKLPPLELDGPPKRPAGGG